MWRHKPDVKDSEKRQHKWKPCDICSLKYKNQSHDLYYKNFEFKILDVAFLILLSVFIYFCEITMPLALWVYWNR